MIDVYLYGPPVDPRDIILADPTRPRPLAGFTWVLHDLGYVLQAARLGVIGETIWLGDLPAEPALGLALLEEAGQDARRELGVVIAERPGVLVLARADAAADAYALAERARLALVAVSNERIGPTATRYLTIEVLTGPEGEGQDSAGRALVGFFVMAEKELSPL